MMKRFFVLALVLCLATAANATLTLTSSAPYLSHVDPIQIGISTDATGNAAQFVAYIALLD